MNMYICTDACTHSNKGIRPRIGLMGHTEMDMFMHNHAMELKQMFGAKCTCIDVLIHINIAF